MPIPSSVIDKNFLPPFFISITILFDRASIEFSTSSFIIETGLSITSPAEINRDISLGSFFIFVCFLLFCSQ